MASDADDDDNMARTRTPTPEPADDNNNTNDDETTAGRRRRGTYVSGTMLHDLNDVQIFDKANKWGTLHQRIQWIIQTLLQGMILLVVGVVEAVIWLVLKLYVIFIFLFYGAILFVGRTLVLWLCPPLAKYSKILADIIDVILWFLNEGFNALFDGVNLIMAFINKDIIGLINDVARALSLHTLKQVHFGGLRWHNIPAVDESEVHAWLTGIPPTCEQFNSMKSIVLWSLHFLMGPSTCKVVRYMVPLEQTYNTHFFEALLGWTYPGSATPELFNNHTNCVAASRLANNPTSLEISCVCLGIPYLFLEFFLPLVILRAIIPNLRPGFAKFWEVGVYFFEEIIEAGAELTASLFKSIFLF